MMRPDDLRRVIGDVLNNLGLYSPQVEMLLLGTAATESRLGSYLYQVGGPALGIYQMEPNTFSDIYANYLSYNPGLKARVDKWSVTNNSPELAWNLGYATAMARIQYLRAPEPIPNDLEGCARLYKLRYNTPQGAATEQGFITAYQQCVLRKTG